MKEFFSKKSIKVLIISIVCMLIFAGGIVWHLHYKDNKEARESMEKLETTKKENEKKELEYKLALTQTTDTINTTYTTTKPIADLIENMWHDVCFGKLYQVDLAMKYSVSGESVNKVFDSMGQYAPHIPQGRLDLILPIVFAYEEEKGTMHKIELSTSSAKTQVEKLKNPPKKYKEVYNKTMTYYIDMNSYVGLAKQPQGNYEQYTSKMTDLSTKLQSEYSQIKMMIQ